MEPTALVVWISKLLNNWLALNLLSRLFEFYQVIAIVSFFLSVIPELRWIILQHSIQWKTLRKLQRFIQTTDSVSSGRVFYGQLGSLLVTIYSKTFVAFMESVQNSFFSFACRFAKEFRSERMHGVSIFFIFSDLDWDKLPLTYNKHDATSNFTFDVYKKRGFNFRVKYHA